MTSRDAQPGKRRAAGGRSGAPAPPTGRSARTAVPTYEAALERVGLEPGRRVLDVGCGAGALPAPGRRARRRAARPRRLRGADRVRAQAAAGRRAPVGEMEDLPWGDDTFDLVTGFNSFFFANDMVAGAARGRPRREAGRAGRDPGLGRARALRPRGDEADRAAVPAAATARRAARSRPRPSPGALAGARRAGRADAGRASSTRPGPSSTPTRRRSVARWSPSPGSPSSPAPSASTSSRTAIVDGLAPYRTAPTAATGSRTSTTTSSRTHELLIAVTRRPAAAWATEGDRRSARR